MTLIIRLWANVWYIHVCFYFICFVILVIVLLNLLIQELLFIPFYKISFLFIINRVVTLNLHHYVLYEWLTFSIYTDFLDLLLPPHVHLYHVVYESYIWICMLYLTHSSNGVTMKISIRISLVYKR